jgi:AcrR family transcriptional regulator
MENDLIIEPKERIIRAAADLFAEKGYAAVGVREISKSADVNISMISYYYNGKIGILKAIIERYFENMKEIILRVFSTKQPKEEIMRKFFFETIQLIRKDTAVCKVAIIELPFSVPEVQQYKVKMLKQYLDLIKNQFHPPNTDKKTIHPAHRNENELHRLIVGPAMLGLIFSNFLFSDLIRSLKNVKFDDEFFEEYTDIISTIFLRGVTGLINKYPKNNQCETQISTDEINY